MAMHAKKKKSDYDPARQWGLKPEPESGGSSATYFVAGHVVAGSNDARSLFLSETMGRDAQARASRKASNLEGDRALQQLLKRDKEGTRALSLARQFAKKQARKVKAEVKAEKRGKDTVKGKGKGRPDAESGPESESEREEDSKNPHKHTYSAGLIKQLGFDPTSKDGRKSADPKLQSKVGFTRLRYPPRTVAECALTGSSMRSLPYKRRSGTSTLHPGQARRGAVSAVRQLRWPNPRATPRGQTPRCTFWAATTRMIWRKRRRLSLGRSLTRRRRRTLSAWTVATLNRNRRRNWQGISGNVLAHVSHDTLY